MKIFLTITLLSCFSSIAINFGEQDSKIIPKNRIVIKDTVLSKKSFPHKELKRYRISKELKLTTKINETLHSRLFHELNSINSQYLHTSIPSNSNNEYLVDFRTVKVNRRYQKVYKCNVITLLKKKANSSRLYWLSFLAEEYLEIGLDTINFEKGKFANYGVFAEKYQNDTIKYESFSEFVNDSIIKKTKIEVRKKQPKYKDSTIYYFETGYGLFNDISYYWKGVEKYRNDSLIRKDFSNELSKK